MIVSFNDKIVLTNKDVYYQGKYSNFIIEALFASKKVIDEIKNKHFSNDLLSTEQKSICMSNEIFTRQVINWSGIVDEDGNQLLCNEENKKLMTVRCIPFVCYTATGIIERSLNSVIAEEISSKTLADALARFNFPKKGLVN